METLEPTGEKRGAVAGRRLIVIRILAGVAALALLTLAYLYFLLPSALPWNDSKDFGWFGDSLDYLSSDFSSNTAAALYSGDYHDIDIPSWGNDDVFAVLIFGFDYDYPGTIRQGGGTPGRTDAIMLLIMPKDRSSATVVSIPRDTLVPVDSYGTKDRINTVYRGISPEGLERAVSYLTGIEPDRWASMDFAGFVKVVDRLGGVDVEIEDYMTIWDDLNGRYVRFEPGFRHLDGEESLMYVRFRGDQMGDISRTSRQMRFIRALSSKAMQWNTVGEIRGIMTDISENFNTDMSEGELLSLGLRVLKIGVSNLDGFTLPGSFSGPYWEADQEATRKLIEEAILGPDESRFEDDVAEPIY